MEWKIVASSLVKSRWLLNVFSFVSDLELLLPARMAHHLYKMGRYDGVGIL